MFAASREKSLHGFDGGRHLGQLFRERRSPHDQDRSQAGPIGAVQLAASSRLALRLSNSIGVEAVGPDGPCGASIGSATNRPACLSASAAANGPLSTPGAPVSAT